jgi:hypothetical protein
MDMDGLTISEGLMHAGSLKAAGEVLDMKAPSISDNKDKVADVLP